MAGEKGFAKLMLDDKGQFKTITRDENVKPLTPKAFFVVDLGDKILLLFSKDKFDDVKKGFGDNKEVNFKDLIFDSIIILDKEKASDLLEILGGVLKGDYMKELLNEKPKNNEKQK